MSNKHFLNKYLNDTNQLPVPIHPEVNPEVESDEDTSNSELESDEDNSNFELESDEDNGGQRLSCGDLWCDEEISALDSGVEKFKHIPPVGNKRWKAILNDPVSGKALAKRNASAIRKKYKDLEERRKKLTDSSVSAALNYKNSVAEEICRKRKRTVDKEKVGVKMVDKGKNVAIDSKNIGEKGDESMEEDIDEDISATRIANLVVKKLAVEGPFAKRVAEFSYKANNVDGKYFVCERAPDRRMEEDIDEDPYVKRIANLVVKKLVDDDRFIKRVADFVDKARNVAVGEESSGKRMQEDIDDPFAERVADFVVKNLVTIIRQIVGNTLTDGIN